MKNKIIYRLEERVAEMIAVVMMIVVILREVL